MKHYTRGRPSTEDGRSYLIHLTDTAHRKSSEKMVFIGLEVSRLTNIDSFRRDVTALHNTSRTLAKTKSKLVEVKRDGATTEFFSS